MKSGAKLFAACWAIEFFGAKMGYQAKHIGWFVAGFGLIFGMVNQTHPPEFWRERLGWTCQNGCLGLGIAAAASAVYEPLLVGFVDLVKSKTGRNIEPKPANDK